MVDTTLLLISTLLIILGFLGILFPILPGVPLVYGGLLAYAFGAHPPELTTTVLVVFGILTVISLVFDLVGRFAGARYGQISRAGTIGGIIGLLIGILFAPLGGWSIIFLPPLGVIIGEMHQKRDRESALRAGWWTLIGTVVPMLLNFLIASTMVIWFIRAAS